MTIPLTKTLLGACVLAILVAPAVAAQDLSADPMQGDAMPGKLWVQFTDEVPSAGFAQTGFEMFDRIAVQYDVETVDKAFPFLDGFAAVRTLSKSGEALRRTYEVSYSAPFNPLVVAAALAADPNVVYAEPRYYDYVFKEPAIPPDPLERPNDPEWSEQDDYLGRVEIEAAWDEVKGSDSTFVVAIVDTGTDWEHEDLVTHIWENEDEIAGNGIDDDDNGFVDDIRGWNFSNDSNDPTGTEANGSHGTQTAGTAAATTNNETGIAGTSWNAQLMPINAACADIDALCHTIDGVLYAAMNGASVINASYGSASSSETGRNAMQTALDEGALVVAASGNHTTDSDRQPYYPAGYNQTLSVGGTQKEFDINQYNYGRSVNVYLASIGISVTSTNDTYGTANGTSFSAPLASGIAALVKTKFPEWGPERVREQMRLTADEMDTSNPSSFDGKFGRGRVNALRAVTEDPLPGVRVAEWSWIDDDGNGALIKGETATVTIKFKNYHGDAEGLAVGIETESAHDSWVDITTASVDIGSLANGDSTTASLVFEVTDSAPNNSTLLLYTRITADGDFTDSPDIMRIPFNNTDTATHDTGDLQVSITSQGNIGYLDFQPDGTGGVGFKPIDANGQVRDILFEGGLIVASSASDVSDCLRGAVNQANPGQNTDFGLKDTFIELLTDGVLTTQRGRLTLVETDSTGTVGVEILQESYVDNNTLYSDGIILAYTLRNVTESTLEDVHVGLFFDWDVAADYLDHLRWDDERNMGYVMPDTTDPDIVVGTKVLTDEGEISYRAIDNANEIIRDATAGGFTDDEKYEWISDGVNVTVQDDIDASQITGVGPFTIESGAEVLVAFAVVAGKSVDDFQSNVDNMQDLWDNVIDTSVEGGETPVAASFTLRGVYPNPTSSKATLFYELETRGEVTLAVYDVLGRRVRTVWSGQRNVGTYETEWDGLDDAGARVAAGVYMVTMTATDGKQRVRTTRPLVLVK